MKQLGRVSADQVLDAFRGDQKVVAITAQWPDNPFMRAVLVRIAQRPVDHILTLAWSLYELDREELLQKVHLTVWPPAMSLGATIEAFRKGTRKTPDKVQELAEKMKRDFRGDDFLLTGYHVTPDHIQLEDGYNRVTAAGLAGVVPATVKMYLGERPVKV